MLAKRYKLPIQTVVSKRARITKSPYFLVKILTSEAVFSRFGVTVSVKVAKKATERNRLRRMAYNFLAANGSKLPIADYWISILPSVASLPKEQFISELNKILK